MSFIILWNVAGALHSPNDMATHTIKGLKHCFVDVLITYSNLLEAGREVEMRVKICVLKLIECVVHTWQWVGVLTRNLIKPTVVTAQA
jgi:hypothetical protein